jgi:hypothetical protein
MYYGKYYSGLGQLGRTDWTRIRQLPPRLRQIVMDEMDNTESIEGIKQLLRAPNPARAIAAEIANEAVQAMREPLMVTTRIGMGDMDGGLGKFKFKKVIKKIKSVHKKVHAKITPKFMQKIEAKIKKVGKKVWKKYGTIIITIVGAVLAPFTAGTSLLLVGLATTALNAANSMYQAKRRADEAKKAGKKEAVAAEAAFNEQQKQVNADADKLFNEAQNVFAAAGITPEKWKALTVDQKIAVIEKINKGEMPAIGAAVAEAVKDGDLPAGAQATGMPSIPNQPSFGYISSPDPSYAPAQWSQIQAQAAPSPYPPQKYAYKANGAPQTGPESQYGQGPTSLPSLEEQRPPADVAPTIEGKFEVYVEGRKVGDAPNSEDMAKLISRNTSPGDRIEVLFNGKSAGLKLRTEGGIMNVPTDQEHRVRSMTPDDVRALVARATELAQKHGGEKPGGGFPWWIVLAGGGAVAAVAAAA